VHNARPVRTLVLALLMLCIGLVPTALGEFLASVGMADQAARIAGSQLTVMTALCGAGLLLIAIARWARALRLNRTSDMHAELLNHLSSDVGAQSQVVPGVGAVVVADFEGLRTEVVIPPEVGADVTIRALCMPGRMMSVWPRGLGPAEPVAGQSLVSFGEHWEAWGDAGASVLEGADAVLEAAFGEGGLLYMSHGVDGIEISLPNAPPEHLLTRLRIGLRLASTMARLNR